MIAPASCAAAPHGKRCSRASHFQPDMAIALTKLQVFVVRHRRFSAISRVLRLTQLGWAVDRRRRDGMPSAALYQL